MNYQERLALIRKLEKSVKLDDKNENDEGWEIGGIIARNIRKKIVKLKEEGLTEWQIAKKRHCRKSHVIDQLLIESILRMYHEDHRSFEEISQELNVPVDRVVFEVKWQLY